MNDLGFDQLINEPTRNTNILDLIFTNNKNLVDSVQVVESFDPKLDHKIIMDKINLVVPKTNKITRKIRCFNIENLQTLNSNLCDIPWQTCLFSHGNSIDDITDNFYSILGHEINSVVPFKLITVRKSDKPGMTAYVRKLLNKARSLNKIAKLLKTLLIFKNINLHVYS